MDGEGKEGREVRAGVGVGKKQRPEKRSWKGREESSLTRGTFMNEALRDWTRP